MELVATSQPNPALALYRPRQPQNSALYQLLEAYYEDVKALWEERFEKKYGFWRGFVEAVVARYLDCGVAETGFARLKCDDCGSERLLTLSCKQRGICPSCDAKRAAAFAAFLKDELLSNVGHRLWTFTLPKMLRPYFMRQRELLGDLARLAYETIKELMLEAVGDPHARPEWWWSRRRLEVFSIHIPMLTALPLVGFGMPKENGSLSLTSIPALRKNCFATRSFAC